MIPICPVVSFTYGESNVARGGLCHALSRPRAAGRRGGWGQLRGGGGGRHPGVRVSEGVRGGRRTAARPRSPPARAASHGPFSLPCHPSAPRPLHDCPPAMGPDSPCPPQCPAGWGKMPKWRPATTLDSPTAGRRRRRLRPSIGNGSPPSPFFLSLRAPRSGSRRRSGPKAASAPAPAVPPREPGSPRQARPGGGSPHPSFPALSPSAAGSGWQRTAAPRGAEMGEG